MEVAVKNLIIVGDRVLIRPETSTGKTKSGLYLPPGVKEKEKIQTGLVIRVGPGYALPSGDFDEDWKSGEERIRYIPLQAQEGDTAIFLLNAAHEIIYNEEKYYIVPQQAILMLERDNEFYT